MDNITTLAPVEVLTRLVGVTRGTEVFLAYRPIGAKEFKRYVGTLHDVAITSRREVCLVLKVHNRGGESRRFNLVRGHVRSLDIVG